MFLPAVLFLYWMFFNKTVPLRNGFILFVSYLFYGCWDWRFLFLIVFMSGVCFFAGLRIGSGGGGKWHNKGWLLFACVVCFGLLGVFKYFNFFLDNASVLLRVLGVSVRSSSLRIILPVGVSFFTFQAMSYVIDVYRGSVAATRDWVAFFAYISFFPQLVAGPIERSTNLLPQFDVLYHRDYKLWADGLRQMLWGFFKKVVIADNCAIIVNDIYANYEMASSGMLLYAAMLFAFQIYGDFSGYSDIAIGCARLFGFRLMRNFACPYFSRSMAEFWRRWHISLSTWFRDYLYFPLGGSRGSRWRTVRNVFLLFVVSGLWHGANWTFMFWGALNAFYFLPRLLKGQNRMYTDSVAAGRWFPSLKEACCMFSTFSLTVVAWVFFRAETMSKAMRYLYSMVSFKGGQAFFSTGTPFCSSGALFMILLLFLTVEWIQREKPHPLFIREDDVPYAVRLLVYYGVLGLILVFGATQQTFIYFQF